MDDNFTVVLRGYDMTQVKELLARADAASASESVSARAEARHELAAAEFRQRLRGYARAEVDAAVRQRITRLTR